MLSSKFPLSSGRWLGKGSFLSKGQSLTTQVDLGFEVVSESVGTHLKGVQTFRAGTGRHAFAVWVTGNDTGTFDLAAQFGAMNFTGNAKLESFPNLALLWTKDADRHVAVSLFEVRHGFGCRGFYHAGDALVSFEIMLESHDYAAQKESPNVIAIDPRKRRR